MILIAKIYYFIIILNCTTIDNSENKLLTIIIKTKAYIS